MSSTTGVPPEEIEITTDQTRFDPSSIIQLLRQTHFAAHRSDAAILKSLKTSLCFGAFLNSRQVGFGRVITDYATTAYLCDMAVAPDLRGQGIGQKLLQAILAEPSLKDLKWILRTKDAASLYARFDFIDPALPSRYMERTPGNRGWDNT
jgi:GNAT superfamily N-acetyltransferase